MFGNNSFNNSNTLNVHTSTPTSWHPIQTTSSFDMWELPTPSRSLTTDEEERSETEPRASAPSSENFLFDFENQFLAPLLSSWSFSSPRQEPPHHTHHRPRLGSMSSMNSQMSIRTTQSHGERSQTKKQALGDATNTAPVLRLPRSRFL
jgi:hypothetical protein